MGDAGCDLEAHGRAAHAEGDYVVAVGSYEEAYAAYREEGDLAAAARAARTVGWFRGWVFGEWAVHRGWLARARAMLEQSGDDAGLGWVVLDDAQRGNDLARQRAQYEEAIALARRSGDPDLECEATASLGMMLVFSGLVDEGMAYLDAALGAICAGDVEKAFTNLATEEDEFAVWFRAQVLEISGFDLAAPDDGPLPELVLEWTTRDGATRR